MSDFENVCGCFKTKNIFTPATPANAAADKLSCCDSLDSIPEEDKKYLKAYVLIQNMEDYFLSKPEALPRNIRRTLYNRGIDIAKAQAKRRKGQNSKEYKLIQAMEDYFMNEPEKLPADVKRVLYSQGIDKAKDYIFKIKRNQDNTISLAAGKVSTPDTLKKIMAIITSRNLMTPAPAVRQLLAAIDKLSGNCYGVRPNSVAQGAKNFKITITGHSRAKFPQNVQNITIKFIDGNANDIKPVRGTLKRKANNVLELKINVDANAKLGDRTVQVLNRGKVISTMAKALKVTRKTVEPPKKSAKIDPSRIYRGKTTVTKDVTITFKNYSKLPDTPQVEVLLGNSADAKVKAVAGSIVRFSDNTLKLKISVEKDAKIDARTLEIKGFANLPGALQIADKPPSGLQRHGEYFQTLNMRFGPDREGNNPIRLQAEAGINTDSWIPVAKDARAAALYRNPNFRLNFGFGSLLDPIPIVGPGLALYPLKYFEFAMHAQANFLILGRQEDKGRDYAGMLRLGINPRLVLPVVYFEGIGSGIYQGGSYQFENLGFPSGNTVGYDVGGAVGFRFWPSPSTPRTHVFDLAFFAMYGYRWHDVYSDKPYGTSFQGLSQSARIGARASAYFSELSRSAPDIRLTVAGDPWGNRELPLDAEGRVHTLETNGNWMLEALVNWRRLSTMPFYLQAGAGQEVVQTYDRSTNWYAALGLRKPSFGWLDFRYLGAKNLTTFYGQDLHAGKIKYCLPATWFRGSSGLCVGAEVGMLGVEEGNPKRYFNFLGSVNIESFSRKRVVTPKAPAVEAAPTTAPAARKAPAAKVISFKNPKQYLNDKCAAVAGSDKDKCVTTCQPKKTKADIDKCVDDNYKL